MLTFDGEVETRRAPHGARGLKCVGRDLMASIGWSRPARGAWVEILLKTYWRHSPQRVAPRTGRVG